MTTHERQMLIPKAALFGQVGLYTGFGKKKIARSNPEKMIIELKKENKERKQRGKKCFFIILMTFFCDIF